MKSIIESYIADHDKAWEDTTKKSESARLNALVEYLDGNPETLWTALETKGIKPYSRVTAWSRVVNLWDWGIQRGHFPAPNTYKMWREKNARLFKHAYERKTPEISFEEAERRINSISNEAIRRKALELLRSGLRYSESFTLNHSNTVRGKGGKKRTAFVPKIEGPNFQGSYFQFWKELNKIGLKPHTLRKLKATDLARKGMDFSSICEAMGWSRMETVMSYVAPIKKEEMRRFFE